MVLWLSAACDDATPGQDAGSHSSAAAGSAALAAGERLRILAGDEDGPGYMAIDDRYVYWTTRTALRRMSIEGGPVKTLATSAGISDIAAAHGGVFFTDPPAGTVSYVEREGGVVTTLATGEWPTAVAVAGGIVYWSDVPSLVNTATLRRMRVDGSDANVMLDSLSDPSDIAVDDSFVYLTSSSTGCTWSSEVGGGCYGGGVRKVPRAGGPAQVVDTRGTSHAIAVGPGGTYWLTDDQGLKVMFAPTNAGPTVMLADVRGESMGPVVADANAVYLSSSDRGRVLKISHDEIGAKPVAVDLGRVGGIAVDHAWIYVAAKGQILRVAKDGSAAQPRSLITGPCPKPIGSAEEIAVTPRWDGNLELLALYLDEGRLTASRETYARVVADINAIRAANPSLADVGFYPRSDGKGVQLLPDEITAESIRRREYSAWDCLNEFYGLETLDARDLGSGLSVFIRLKGIYDMRVVANVYRRLPGITKTQASGYGFGDSSTICAKRDGATITYVIDRRGGDCPAGCTTSDAYAFRSTEPGEIQLLGHASSGLSTEPPNNASPAAAAAEWYSTCEPRF
jgi:phage tail protein X